MFRIIGLWVALPLATVALSGLFVGLAAIWLGDAAGFFYLSGAGVALALSVTALAVGYMLRDVRT